MWRQDRNEWIVELMTLFATLMGADWRLGNLLSVVGGHSLAAENWLIFEYVILTYSCCDLIRGKPQYGIMRI